VNPLLDSASEGEVGGTALVVAHANSLRALIGVICNVEGQRKALKKLEKMKIPTASPMILRYRTTKDGSYVPVGSALDDELKNEFPVYPLSYLPQLRKQNNASKNKFISINNETDDVNSKAKQWVQATITQRYFSSTS
jgi:broad specificity phosphatase PhoE